MLKIGLTGGIGCGKSTVTALFEEFDIPVIDADVIARKLVATGEPALKKLEQIFGKQIINNDGSLDRHKLKEQVFSNVEKKQKLENILHPLIYAEINQEISTLEGKPYCIISIPLLIETAKTGLVDRILVVDCPVALQITRVKQRDQLSETQIQTIINTQASRADRLAAADDIIENSKTTLQLAQQVKKLHNLYLLLSST